MRYNKCIKCESSQEVLRVMANKSLHQFCGKCGIDLTAYASNKGKATKRANKAQALAKAHKRRIVTRQRRIDYGMKWIAVASIISLWVAIWVW